MTGQSRNIYLSQTRFDLQITVVSIQYNLVRQCRRRNRTTKSSRTVILYFNVKIVTTLQVRGKAAVR